MKQTILILKIRRAHIEALVMNAAREAEARRRFYAVESNTKNGQ